MTRLQSDEEQAHRDGLARAVRSVPRPPAGMSTIDKIRQVVKDRTATRVDGVLVDAFSASLILGVYGALAPDNQAKFARMPVRRMAAVAFKVAG